VSARDAILGRLQKSLNEDNPSRPVPKGIDDAPAVVRERLQNKPVSTLPAFSEEPTERLIRMMEAVQMMMESVQMSVTRVQTSADVVNAVEDYIATEALDGDVTVAPALAEMNWPDSFRSGTASGVESTSVTPCLSAVAETGSVVFASSETTPATLNFLPDNHIVVVNESQVVNHVDDVWAQLRQAGASHRAVNFVTGPSRTGDIEQAIEIGAHGMGLRASHSQSRTGFV